MANEQVNNYDEIRKMLERFHFDIDPQLSVHVVCIICHKILIDAYQGPCGCNYCKKCIKEYLEKEKFCPGSSTECKTKHLSFDKNLIKDNGANRKISKLHLKCPLNGCEYENELNNLANHIKTCKSISNYCPFLDLGCKIIDLDSGKISEHLQKQIYDHNRLIVDWMTNLKTNMFEIIENSIKKTDKIINEQNQYYDRELLILKEKCRTLEKELPISKTSSDNKSKLDSQDSLIASYKWNINNLSQKKKTSHHIMSGYFLSIKNDYEMRLRLCHFGHDMTNENSMTLKFFIHKGKNDAETKWPFRGNICIIIRNKLNPNCCYKTSRYCEIEQPSIGHDSRVIFDFSNSDLKNPGVLNNDSIIIECNITEH